MTEPRNAARLPYVPYPKGIVTTKVGQADCTITSDKHVSIMAGGSSARVPGFEYRGRQYYSHIHLFLQPDGQWRPNKEDRSDVYVDGCTEIGRKTIKDAVVEGWNTFIRENADLLVSAQLADLSNNIVRMDEDIAKAKVSLEEFEAKRKDLLRQEEEILKKEDKKDAGRQQPDEG